MRLADFIEANLGLILAEWETFARTCTPASGDMDVVALRDHAGAMLKAIVADLRTPQSEAEQSAKSKGRAPVRSGPMTAAEEHGSERAESGFEVDQMVAEYRALRASVIRLWTEERGELKGAEIADLTRFNEAIDQALAESVMRFSQSVEGSKEMFLAILGHDLRTPLNAILASARLIIDIPENADLRADLSARIVRSARRMNQMVGDLLDFTRTRLGSGIPVTRDSTDMGELINEVVKELEVSRSERTVQVDLQVAEARGEWDSARIGQVLTNMIGNALDHGMAGNPVHVIIGGDEQEIRITIHNRGPAIPPERLKRIFHPMKSGEVKAGNRAAGQHGSLGLGLFIANEIIVAHHGRIEVQSSDADGTTFTIHLPRSSASVAHRPAH